MHIHSLAKPPSEKEIAEMQTINQENIPEVGDLSELEDFRARVNWSENIFVYKWEDIIKAFDSVCGKDLLTIHQIIYIYQTVSKNFFMLIELLCKRNLEEKV